MQTLVERGCGLDVHQATVVACLLIVLKNGQVQKVPGRKTDVKDAEWIADLLCHGLLRSSFVPPKPIRELRDLTRYRRKLVESQAAERNRLLKLLESANIKLASVATDVFGVSGRLMLQALVEGKASLAAIEQRIQQKLEPYAAQVSLLQEIPGVDWTLAAVIIAELGVDMSVFQCVSQLASWAGV